uniref:Putative reverse transcriptase rna-dependent dna polymerase n=1 Tax=Triatoma infestans TaxID=30076 RepID=A0A023F705_TRIIF
MIPKPSKPTHLPSSYRPISLLSILGKIFERLLLPRLQESFDGLEIIPNHQFGFRSCHSTIQQAHRVVDTIATSLELKHFCAGVFLDVSQAFDRVWHKGLLWKLKGILPSTYYLILKSYLSDRFFLVTQGSSRSSIFPVLAGVPQGSVLAPLLYTIFTADLPSNPNTSIYTFADDTAILSTHTDSVFAIRSLQSHLHSLEPWLQKWRIKINPNKSKYIVFTLKRTTLGPVFLYNTPIPPADHVRYLGLYLDKRLTWNPHTRLKRAELNKRYKLLARLLDKRSKLTLQNKRRLYTSLLAPIWTYGLELYGTAKRSNINRLQTLQSKILRRIVNAPFYVSNHSIHTDLNIPFIPELAKTRYNKFHQKLSFHPNPLAANLFSTTLPSNPRRRLRRRWPRDQLVD